MKSKKLFLYNASLSILAIGMLSACLDTTSAPEGEKGADGTSCSAKELKDKSGYELSCNGEVVGTIKNGEDGVDGIDGKDGTSCSAKELDDKSGFKIVCGGEVVGTIKNGEKGIDGKDGENGKDGTACTAKELSDKSGYELTCDGEVVGIIKNGKDAVVVDDTSYGLGDCTLARQNTVARFTVDNQYYICKTGAWKLASLLEIDTYQQVCNATNEGEIITGLSSNIKYTCTNGKWTYANLLWNGANGDYRVDTGLDDGSDESGYWYSYDDENFGGSSAITWPVATGNAYDYFALDPIIDKCGGLCGDVSLGAGYDYPFVGVGFNLTGPDLTGADITSWGGICVIYTATGIAPILELSPEDEANLTEYNNYIATLPLSLSATSVDLPWSRFKQESGWGNKVDQAEYLTKVAAINFKFSDKAGTSGHFNIIAIGKYGTCSN